MLALNFPANPRAISAGVEKSVNSLTPLGASAKVVQAAPSNECSCVEPTRCCNTIIGKYTKAQRHKEAAISSLLCAFVLADLLVSGGDVTDSGGAGRHEIAAWRKTVGDAAGQTCEVWPIYVSAGIQAEAG
jgi:hypothetical protein